MANAWTEDRSLYLGACRGGSGERGGGFLGALLGDPKTSKRGEKNVAHMHAIAAHFST